MTNDGGQLNITWVNYRCGCGWFYEGPDVEAHVEQHYRTGVHGAEVRDPDKMLAPEQPDLLRYVTSEDVVERDALFLRIYATHLRNGTAATWEIPNTIARTLEDISRRIEQRNIKT